MENKIYGIIYKITNLINGKVYIGQTKQRLRQRWSGHKYCSKNNTNNMNISKAIKKYRPENFTIEKIDEADSFESLNLLEEYYIKKYNSCDKKVGYNIDKIHNGVKYRSTRIKNKMSKLNKSKKRRKISSNNGLSTRGKKRNGNFVGVNKTKNNTYNSAIGYNNKLIYLGTYNKESDAAKAYDIKAIDLYGKDCLLNFPELRISYINKEIFVNKIKKSNSGVKYLRYDKRRNKWFLHIPCNDIHKTVYFKNKQDAIDYLLVIYPNHDISNLDS